MTSEIKAYVPGWIVEKLFEDGEPYGINIRDYGIIPPPPQHSVYDKAACYHFSIVIRHQEGTNAVDLFDEAVHQLRDQHLNKEPETKPVMKTVNKEAYEQRIEDAACNCYVAIEHSWNQGKPKVILEVDTDIYHKVKEQLFKDFEELAFTRIGVTEGYTSNTKKGTTKFAITNKKY